jgi:hypothetical protein
MQTQHMYKDAIHKRVGTYANISLYVKCNAQTQHLCSHATQTSTRLSAQHANTTMHGDRQHANANTNTYVNSISHAATLSTLTLSLDNCRADPDTLHP